MPHPKSDDPSRLAPDGGHRSLLMRLVLWTFGLGLAGVTSLAIVIGVALSVAYPNLPDVSDLASYRPKLPLRIYSADGALIGEFGEERRSLTPIAEIPQVMKQAVLAIEDARFYEHNGVDYRGLMRAAIANLGQGAAGCPLAGGPDGVRIVGRSQRQTRSETVNSFGLQRLYC